MSDDDAYLLGKTVNVAVISEDNLFALPAGSVITPEVLAQAKAHDAVLQLALHVD